MTATPAQIARLYTAAFNRAPDAAGLAYWTSAVDAGTITVPEVSAWFSASPELTVRYGLLTDDAFVRQLYQNVLGRAGEQDGITYWDSALAAGDTRGNILDDFAQSAENVTRTAELIAPPVPVAAIAPPTPAVVAAPVPTPVVTPPPAPPPDPNMTIAADTTLNQGTATSPFVTADIIGQHAPTLTVTGFIHANNVTGLHEIDITRPFGGPPAGLLEVTGTLDPNQAITLSGGDLIIDHPGTELLNAISGSGVIELPGVNFDAYSFNPFPTDTGTSAGALIAEGGSVTLTKNGVTVYTIDSWKGWGGSSPTLPALPTDGNPYIHLGWS